MIYSFVITEKGIGVADTTYTVGVNTEEEKRARKLLLRYLRNIYEDDGMKWQDESTIAMSRSHGFLEVIVDVFDDTPKTWH